MRNGHLVALSLSLSLVLISGALAAAQNIPALNDTTTPAPSQPGHALIQGPHETVDPANGQVTLSFNVPLPAEPGGQPRFAITYSSAGAVFATGKPSGGAELDTQWSALSSQGWSYTAPVLTFSEVQTSPNGTSDCGLSTGYILEAPDGQRHSFHLSVVGDNTKSDPQDGCPQQYLSDAEPDGWTATTPGDTQPGPYGTRIPTITSAGGSVFTFSGGGIPEFGWLPARVTDPNGNWLAYALNAASNNALTITDSLGRTLLTTTGFQPAQTYSSLTDTITADGEGGPVYTATWQQGPPAASLTITPAGTFACPVSESTGGGGDGPVITSLTTPEGTYTFSYDPTYGVLDRITYPNGGYVRYVWGETASPAESGDFYTPAGNGTPTGCEGVYPGVVITDRYVSPDGVNETEHQQFTYTTTWNTSDTATWKTKTTQVTTTDSISGATWTTDYTYTPEPTPAPANSPLWEDNTQIPVEHEVSIIQNSATLRDVIENWTLGYPYLLADHELSLNTAAIGEQCYQYSPAGQLMDKQEFESIPGCNQGAIPVRETTVSYASFSQNIVNRPAQVTVYTGAAEGGKGTVAADTNFGYDAKGNLTSSARWLAGVPNPGGGGTFLTTTYTVDGTGRRTGAVDPAGNTTTYQYNGTDPDGVHPTEISDATGNRYYKWNAAAGTLAIYTDVNGHNTTYQYDSWNRLSWIGYPAGGGTSYSYTPSTLEIEREQTSALNEETLDTFDGLGRLAVAATETSVGNWSRVDTCYDGAGEKSFVSYPYSSSSSGGAANCNGSGQKFQYDALGRTTQTTNADGSTVLTSYSRHDTETQDEGNGAARLTRIAQTDGLGRLASVCEVTGATDAAGYAPLPCGLDTAGTGFLTSYTYDTLDDLTAVDQIGKDGDVKRTFTYDNTGRLTSSDNPETGPITYTYDSDSACPAPNAFAGDLVARTDARGIRTCYQYNGAHQITEKSYSDGTPTAYYGYGQSSALGISGLANVNGRLSSEYTAANAGQVFSYDADGREVGNDQITPGVWGSSSFNYSYAYDLAGDETSATLPKGATLTQTFDLAGRPLSLSSSVNGALISSVTYNARGEELSSTLGNGITDSRGYDARGRLTSLTDITAQQYVPGTPGTGSITISGSERMGGPPGCIRRSCSVWDTGDVWGTVNTVQEYANFGQGSTAAALAGQLATALNNNPYITASASGDVVSITAKSTGTASNYALSAGADTQFGSFSATASGTSLTGGTNGYYTGGQTIYSLSGMSYAPDGDLLGVTDSVNGVWTYSYTALNQLAQACTPNCSGTVLSYSYDRFGNRWAAPTGNLTFTSLTNQPAGYGFNASGDLTSASGHSYAFDAEGRITAVDGGSTASYVYDAEGRRVREDVGGVVKEYVYGLNGELTVLDGSHNLMQTETNFDGRYLGTREATTFVWALGDELGTVRMRTNASGGSIETDTSWPFGANLNNVGAYSNLHFTGKYRDSETGLDDFGARYYDSSLGRFLTPDWNATPQAVPYANLANPQSLNLYIYEGDNPASNVDKDGHCWPWCTAAIGAAAGAVVGAGAEALSEALRGQSLNAPRIEHAAVGGALAGAIIGVTGPVDAGEALDLGETATAVLNVGGSVAGNLIGGATERVLNKQKVASAGAVITDALSGAAGGGTGLAVKTVVASTVIREGATDLIDTVTGAVERDSGDGGGGKPKRICKGGTPCAGPAQSPAGSGSGPSGGGGVK